MHIIYEIIGYLGTALVILSMTMTSVTKLRIFNISGAILSAIYALLIAAYPVALLNITLTAINLFHLIRAHQKRKKHAERTTHETEN